MRTSKLHDHFSLYARVLFCNHVELAVHLCTAWPLQVCDILPSRGADNGTDGCFASTNVIVLREGTGTSLRVAVVPAVWQDGIGIVYVSIMIVYVSIPWGRKGNGAATERTTMAMGGGGNQR